MTKNANLSSQLISAFSEIVGEKYALRDNTHHSEFIDEPRGRYRAPSPLVLIPENVEQVSQIMALAYEHDIKIVPQGGNTGLVGGQVPSPEGREVIIVLSRLNKIREIDTAANAITLDAGCILQNVQDVASENDRFFPLRIGSQGSCQIGGNIAANAGGTGALAYGVMRDLVMGLEVVMPDGRIWNGLNKLKKNNTGYDLKHLFIGGEGTLGIITGATLKLFAKPKGSAMAYIGIGSPREALNLFNILQSRLGNNLTAFELIDDNVWGLLLKHFAQKHTHPLSRRHEWYCLLEVTSQKDDSHAQEQLIHALEEAFESIDIADSCIGTSIAQQKEFWLMRENLAWAQFEEGASIKHDISLPVSAVPQFIARAQTAISNLEAGARVTCFGHMGDGNLHYNVMQPEGWEKERFFDLEPQINDLVYDLINELNGSISAEHGIGQIKRDKLRHLKQGVELDLMLAIRETIDPKGIMNPKKLI